MARRRSAYVRGVLASALLAVSWAPEPASAADPVLCETSEATIVGTDGPDELIGLPGVDVIAGLGGDDHISGDLVDDVVCGGEGSDTIIGAGPFRAFGGPDDDHLEATAGGEIFDYAALYGGDGDDVVVVGKGQASLYGGDGDDTLLGSSASNSLYPGLGRDTVDGGDGVDSLNLEPDAGPVTVDLARGFAKGQGRDTVTAIEGIVGTLSGDRLSGDDGPNRISGVGADDVVHGRAGDDELSGDGTLLGGEGDDAISGGWGATADHLDGGAGYDWLRYGVYAKGPVTVDLEAGTTIGPRIGNDVALRFEAVEGTPGSDTLLGNDVDNQLDGWEGWDRLDGRGGNDDLRGLSENDTLLGGPGDDVLDGGRDTNTLNGGPGTDTCYRGTRTSCEK